MSARIARQPLWRPISALGVITYSLYLVHQFNLNLANSLASRVVPVDWEVARVGIALAILLLIATLFWYCCERPFLNRVLAPRTLAPADERTRAPLEVLPQS